MAWTLCTSGAAVAAAGTFVNTSIQGNATELDNFSNQAEGAICAECHTDFVSNYANFDTEIQNALQTICAAKIAKKLVKYDMSGYTDRREAETILDVLDDEESKGLQTLNKKQFQRFSE